ncbi:hypothetical protein AHF37_12203 [Paragonimus kellicotti]|nr:hypothetical protein AHF37_12203 [Paragonimus kellicotti]
MSSRTDCRQYCDCILKAQARITRGHCYLKRDSLFLVQLNTDWTEVEVIELLVDSAASLGFGMCGSKSTGIVVRQIHPGGAAEMDGRLRIGDHIVCVQDFNVRGFGPDQVATVLRHTISVSLFAAGSSDHGTTSVMHTDPDLGTSGGFQPNELNPEDSMAVESSLQSVAVRFIVARPAVGNPDELNEIYVEQQNRFNELQVPASLGIVPTERLDDYLETLLHSAIPFMALEPDPSVEPIVDPITDRQPNLQLTADTKSALLTSNDASIKTTYFGDNFERFLCSISSGDNEVTEIYDVQSICAFVCLPWSVRRTNININRLHF